MKEKRKLAVVMACSLIFAQSISLFGVKGLEKTEAKGLQTFTVYRGKSASLTITQKGKKKKTGRKYHYQVANKKIATISAKGKVKGKKAGTTKVTLQKKSNRKKIKIKVKVVDYVKELRLSSATNVMLQEGGKKSVRALVYPKTAKNRKVEYKSSNSSIATVASNGVVRAVQSGFATITIKTKGTTKKGKKLSKKVQIYVAADTPSAPTPNVPDGNSTVIGNGGSTDKPDDKPDEKPKTLEQAIKEIPTPDSSTLLAASFVVKEAEATSTLYFVNRAYQGTMHVTVDGMDMTSNSGVINALKRLETEVTGKGNAVSVNPGNKPENKFYDEKLGLWRDILLVSRVDLSSAWLIKNLKSGQQYHLMAWQQDKKYGTPYGMIITEGDTTSKIVVY